MKVNIQHRDIKAFLLYMYILNSLSLYTISFPFFWLTLALITIIFGNACLMTLCLPKIQLFFIKYLVNSVLVNYRKERRCMIGPFAILWVYVQSKPAVKKWLPRIKVNKILSRSYSLFAVSLFGLGPYLWWL